MQFLISSRIVHPITAYSHLLSYLLGQSVIIVLYPYPAGTIPSHRVRTFRVRAPRQMKFLFLTRNFLSLSEFSFRYQKFLSVSRNSFPF